LIMKLDVAMGLRQIRKQLRRLLRKPVKVSVVYNKHKEEARQVILGRLAYWSVQCGVEVKRVAIRNQKSRWGSCSAHGNLNFNYKLLFLPPCLRDYVIVHELCHLKELNHRPAFWQLVEAQIPNYQKLIIELRKTEVGTRMMPYAILKYSRTHVCDDCFLVSKVTS
jgi:predicted metal-dependent hydrolase